FEKQGLFGGAAPDIDVYIDDGRHGEYPYQADHARCAAIWNRHQKDGHARHQAPAANVVNYAYVKIKNRGSRPAKSVVVEAFQNAQAGLVYPDDWKPTKTPQLAAADLPSHSGEVTVGPFEWIPTGADDNYVLMAVSALGDRSNLHKFSTGRSIPDWRLVPHDNHLGLRKT